MQKSTVFLMVVALASAGVSAGLWMQLRTERALNAELSERLHAAVSTPVAPAPVTVEPQPTIVPVVAATPPAPTAVSEPAPARPSRFGPEDWQARQRQLMSDPRYREALREQQRLRLATRRENFIRLLGFSAEQADAVIDLSIDRQMSQQERSIKIASAEDALLMKDRMDAEERAYQAKLTDLLGADKFAQLQTYMETRQSRMQVDQFRTQLTGADALRDDQVEPLIAALHTEQAQMQKELQEFRESSSPDSDPMAMSRQFGERQAELMKATHQRMHAAASGILSSSQLARLDAMLKRDLERQEAQLRMSRIQSKFEQPSVVEIPPR